MCTFWPRERLAYERSPKVETTRTPCKSTSRHAPSAPGTSATTRSKSSVRFNDSGRDVRAERREAMARHRYGGHLRGHYAAVISLTCAFVRAGFPIVCCSAGAHERTIGGRYMGQGRRGKIREGMCVDRVRALAGTGSFRLRSPSRPRTVSHVRQGLCLWAAVVMIPWRRVGHGADPSCISPGGAAAAVVAVP